MPRAFLLVEAVVATLLTAEDAISPNSHSEYLGGHSGFGEIHPILLSLLVGPAFA